LQVSKERRASCGREIKRQKNKGSARGLRQFAGGFSNAGEEGTKGGKGLWGTWVQKTLHKRSLLGKGPRVSSLLELRGGGGICKWGGRLKGDSTKKKMEGVDFAPEKNGVLIKGEARTKIA